jgi:outer membrane protein insertion porin family
MTENACLVLLDQPAAPNFSGGVANVHNNLKALGVLAVLLLSAAIPARAQSSGTFRLAGLRVVGSKRYEASEIVRATGLKLSQNITPDELKEVAGKLGALGIFSQVGYRYQTQGDAMTADFTVQDAAGLLPCTFENFVWFTPKELTDGVRSQLPLFDGYGPQGGTMLDLIAAQLVALLAARGIHAQVQYSPQGGLGGPIQSMQFREIGVPLPVHRIDFTGVANVDAASLQEAARPLLDHDYDASFIQDFSRGSIALVYRRRGYLRVQFGDPVPHLIAGDPTPNAIAVTLPVSEGEKYSLKEITWSGETVIPYEELAKLIHVAVGSPVDASELEQDVLTMVLFFHPKGYLMADVKSKAVLDDATQMAVYQIQIQQGDLFRLGKLEIAGMDDAHARTLEQRCRLRPGDPYDSTYWNRFLQEVGHELPASSSGWSFKPVQTIHADTKTVDVRLVFTARAGQ